MNSIIFLDLTAEKQQREAKKVAQLLAIRAFHLKYGHLPFCYNLDRHLFFIPI